MHTVIKPKPLRPAVPGGFTLDDFTIDEPAGAVTCPAGHTRPMSPKRTVTFGRLCVGCPLRQRCSAAADGRSMSIHPHEQLLRGPRAGPHPAVQAGLSDSILRGADHCLGRHPTRAPHHIALPRRRQEPCLAAQPDRRDQPAHPRQRRPHPP